MTTVTYYPAVPDGAAMHDGAPISALPSNPIKTSGFNPAIHKFPSFAAQVVTRTKVDLQAYIRDKDAMIWYFAFPIVFMAIFAVMNNALEIAHPEYGYDAAINFATLFLPGLITLGVMLSSFNAMSTSLAAEREKGALKRLMATPLTPAAFFTGKALMVLITTVVQAALLIGVSALAFGAYLPTSPVAWLQFAGWMLLGAFSGSMIGILFSNIGSAKANANISNGLVNILAFISGVYMIGAIPTWLLNIARIFPMYWLGSAMRSVFMPAGFYAPEHSLWIAAAVMAAWAVVGLAIVRRTFQWMPKRK
jgi:ABC-2 type transport system permease protein